MKVVLLGSGNVATVLGRLLVKNDHEIVQVISRNINNAKILGSELNTAYTDFNGKHNLTADIFIIATSDISLTDNYKQFTTNGKLVVHTAGAVSKDVLQNISASYGVLYPLQSLRKELAEIPPIPFLIDGNIEATTTYLKEFADSFSANVQVANDEQRVKLHTAAVIVSNFTNYLYMVAEEFCVKENVDFNLLKPLITETANRIGHVSPADVQTGPAIRKDIQTLDKHLRALIKYPKLRTIYMRMTDCIMNP